MSTTSKDKIRDVVRDRYGEIARGKSGCCCDSSSCCSPASSAEASAKLGYSADELAALPEGADMGLGCGNPQAIARLKKGEVVLDLGSGIEAYVVSANIQAVKPSPRGEPAAAGASFMDEKMQELIAIGASIAGHCQPCLSYHVSKAKDLGIDEAEIREAIKVGQMVEKGALSAIRTFADGVFESPAQKTPDCCTGGSVKGCENGCG